MITEIRKKYDVVIQLPKKDDPDQQTITITGVEEKALAARDEILKIVNDLVRVAKPCSKTF